MGGLLFLIIVGAAAGFLGTRLMGMNLPIPHTIAVGVIGAVVGGWIWRLAIGLLGFFGWFAGALLGVFLLLWAYKAFIANR